ncbi:hypothetical protein Bhyg_11693, partial [Pseudolycoriella hygida]
MSSAKNIPRRQAIPIIYTKGTHYDVGFDVGRTFGSLIKNFLLLSGPLNEEFIPIYNTPTGKEIYNETLESVKKSFPQYVRELEGVADGAQVEFYKLFLLHMDDMMPQAAAAKNTISQPVGCSTICVNQPDCEILGHTEDALSEVLNHFYFVSAHIISDTPQGKYNVTEERFTSLCYAGHLPGYTMNYNHHGLVFSINTLSAKNLVSGKTPRHFITRALLGAENFAQAQIILRDSGVGAGNGCSVNMTFLRYLRLPVEEVTGLIIDSSIERMQTFCSFPAPKTKEDVIKMLGDQSAKQHCVFRENNKVDEIVKTVAVGIFDCLKYTWSIYSDNPKSNDPLVVLPLVFKEPNINNNKV